jgi:hypothetical protein
MLLDTVLGCLCRGDVPEFIALWVYCALDLPRSGLTAPGGFTAFRVCRALNALCSHVSRSQSLRLGIIVDGQARQFFPG